METFYSLWDTEFVCPIYQYDALDDALSFVAANLGCDGDGAVATWGLYLSTPTTPVIGVIAEGAALARMAREQAPAVLAAMER